ncbi:MAG: GreA/GreB family elongation factor [Clostridia bacterium]|nr:GreA/GreB family elongation factor [Clostridia bacterium]
MHDELTSVDIDQMKKELEERKIRAYKLREEVQRTREYGDLSENAEYKCAKQEFNKNRSRIRYLENMIRTAVVIEVKQIDGVVNLFDKVTVRYPEDDDDTETVRIVTTLRNDVFTNNISKESPFGRALLGRRVGDTVTVRVNENTSYPVVITAIEKGEDDPDLPISEY